MQEKVGSAEGFALIQVLQLKFGEGTTILSWDKSGVFLSSPFRSRSLEDAALGSCMLWAGSGAPGGGGEMCLCSCRVNIFLGKLPAFYYETLLMVCCLHK